MAANFERKYRSDPGTPLKIRALTAPAFDILLQHLMVFRIVPAWGERTAAPAQQRALGPFRNILCFRHFPPFSQQLELPRLAKAGVGQILPVLEAFLRRHLSPFPRRSELERLALNLFRRRLKERVQVRVNAILATIDGDDQDALKVIRAAIRAEDSPTRATAAIWIGRLRVEEPDLIAALQAAADDEDDWLRYCARNALRRIRESNAVESESGR